MTRAGGVVAAVGVEQAQCTGGPQISGLDGVGGARGEAVGHAIDEVCVRAHDLVVAQGGRDRAAGVAERRSVNGLRHQSARDSLSSRLQRNFMPPSRLRAGGSLKRASAIVLNAREAGEAGKSSTKGFCAMTPR